MEWLIVLCLLLSTINLYLLLKNITKKDFNSELQEFRTYTETLITEFNRITTRNVDLLDSRIEELNHKIRLSQKIDIVLKERFEEAHQIKYLNHLQLDQFDQNTDTLSKSNTASDSIPPSNTISKSLDDLEITETPLIEQLDTIDNSTTTDTVLSLELEKHNDITDTISETDKDDSKETSLDNVENSLFDGVPIPKLKKYKEQSITKKQNKEASLIQHIKDKKSKEELLELGFTSNEINIAYLYYIHQTDQ